MAVPDDDLVVGGDGLQPAVQARHGLWREGHFGHEVDDAPAGREHGCHGMQVDLGLARAGDAVQQMRGKGAAVEAGPHRGHDGGLLFVECGGDGRHHLAMGPVVGIPLAREGARLLASQPALHKRRGDRRGQAEARQHQGFLLRFELLLEKSVEPRLPGRAPGQRGLLVGGKNARHRQPFLQPGRRAAAHRRRQHRLDHRVEPRCIVGAHPSRQLQQVGGQRGKRVHHLRDRLEPVDRKPAGRADLADNAQPVAVEDRHAHERADGHRGAQRPGHTVVQQLVEPRERMHSDDHGLFVTEPRLGWQCGSCPAGAPADPPGLPLS